MIGCFPSGLEPVAAPLAADLASRYPQLRPRIVEVEPEVATSRLRHRELDVVLTYRYHHLGTAAGAGLQTTVLFDEPIALAVPTAAKASVERDGLIALREHPWIVTPPPSGCRDVVLRVCQNAGFTPREEHSFDDLRAGLHLVAAGLGVTILPMLMCGNPPEGAVIMPLPGPGRTVEVAIRAGTATRPAVRAAIEAAQRVTARSHTLAQASTANAAMPR